MLVLVIDFFLVFLSHNLRIINSSDRPPTQRPNQRDEDIPVKAMYNVVLNYKVRTRKR